MHNSQIEIKERLVTLAVCEGAHTYASCTYAHFTSVVTVVNFGSIEIINAPLLPLIKLTTVSTVRFPWTRDIIEMKKKEHDGERSHLASSVFNPCLFHGRIGRASERGGSLEQEQAKGKEG